MNQSERTGSELGKCLNNTAATEDVVQTRCLDLLDGWRLSFWFRASKWLGAPYTCRIQEAPKFLALLCLPSPSHSPDICLLFHPRSQQLTSSTSAHCRTISFTGNAFVFIVPRSVSWKQTERAMWNTRQTWLVSSSPQCSVDSRSKSERNEYRE